MCIRDRPGLVRPIHAARLDKTRPVLVLTREMVRPHLNRVSVAPITSTIRGLSTEVPVGAGNGLDHDSVVNCDNIVTVPKQRSVGTSGTCSTPRNQRSPTPSAPPSTSTDASRPGRRSAGRRPGRLCLLYTSDAADEED